MHTMVLLLALLLLSARGAGGRLLTLSSSGSGGGAPSHLTASAASSAATPAAAAPAAAAPAPVTASPSAAAPAAAAPAPPPLGPVAPEHSQAALQAYARAASLLLPVPCREHLPEVFAARGLLGQAAEIGVLRGDFSRHILSKWPGARLHLVDPWVAQAEGYVDINNANASVQDAALASTRRNVAEHAARVELVRDFSLPAAQRYADAFFDWVYIDADHRYESVVADIAAWWPKVKRGGVLAGHDFVFDGDYAVGRFGVMTAVLEFALREDLQVSVTFGEPAGPAAFGGVYCGTRVPSWYVAKK